MLLAACMMGRAEALTTIRLRADRIAFYYDRFLIEADGHVVVRTSDGIEIRGDVFSMDRGSFASEERSEGGLEEHPRTAIVSVADSQAYSDIVYRWADQAMLGQVIQPNVFPTPYNPAPFPNLPPGIHTPHP